MFAKQMPAQQSPAGCAEMIEIATE